jgi:putative flippase GtrA
VLTAVLYAGISPYGGRIISIIAAIILTWALNRRLTFRTAAPPSWREFGAYGLQSLAGAVLNYAVYSAALWAGAPVLGALVFGTGLAAAFNFVRYRKLLA